MNHVGVLVFNLMNLIWCHLSLPQKQGRFDRMIQRCMMLWSKEENIMDRRQIGELVLGMLSAFHHGDWKKINDCLNHCFPLLKVEFDIENHCIRR